MVIYIVYNSSILYILVLIQFYFFTEISVTNAIFVASGLVASVLVIHSAFPTVFHVAFHSYFHPCKHEHDNYSLEISKTRHVTCKDKMYSAYEKMCWHLGGTHSLSAYPNRENSILTSGSLAPSHARSFVSKNAAGPIQQHQHLRILIEKLIYKLFFFCCFIIFTPGFQKAIFPKELYGNNLSIGLFILLLKITHIIFKWKQHLLFNIRYNLFIMRET